MQLSSIVRSRLAPTPSGFLHIGNAFSFVLTWLLVRYYKGRLLLRIDDIDAERKRSVYVEDIFQTLHWMGLAWEDGPENAQTFETAFSQLNHLHRYKQLLALLQQTGVVYACNCTRTQIQATSSPGLYPGTCRHRNLSLDASNVAWRVYVPPQTIINVKEITGITYKVHLDKEMGDFVVWRKSGLPAYQLASLADDLHYRIDLIVRGKDLLASTAAQLFLAQQLKLGSFGAANFYHHPLLKDAAGKKLSKSAGAASLQTLRGQCQSPALLYRALAQALQMPFENVRTAHDLLRSFNPSQLPNGEETLTNL